jgi:hypothetical protein
MLDCTKYTLSRSHSLVTMGSRQHLTYIDKVQEKALHLVYSLKRTTNQERCQEVELETLEEWRSSQDMTQTFKILNGVDSINYEIFFYEKGRITKYKAGRQSIECSVADLIWFRTRSRSNLTTQTSPDLDPGHTL